MRLLLGLATLAAIPGCFVHLSLPAGAAIECNATSECPGGFICSPSLGLCVTSELGPMALSPSVDPEWATSGTVVRAEFTTAGALASEPVVELQTMPARSFTLAEQIEDRYAFVYTTVGDETPTAFAISATLVDAGGISTTSALGQVSFDFTPPTGSGSRAADAFGNGDIIAQSLGVNEPLGGHPSIVIASNPAVPLALFNRDGNSYSFRYTFDGDEEEGTFSVIATLRDRAGNEGTANLGTITVDHSP